MDYDPQLRDSLLGIHCSVLILFLSCFKWVSFLYLSSREEQLHREKLVKWWHLMAGLRWQMPAHAPWPLSLTFALHPKPEKNSIVKHQRPLKQKNHLSPPTQHCQLCQTSPPSPPNATFTPEKLSLERVWLFHLVWCFWDSIIHQRCICT